MSIVTHSHIPHAYFLSCTDVTPSKGTLTVGIVLPRTSLQEGQEMSLSCNVDTRNLEERFFSVAWVRDTTELARIGPTGVLSVGPEYSGRESGGELRASRIGDTDHRLILRPVRTQDQGEYRCRAWPQNRGADGTFTQGAAQDSTTQQVTISATGTRMSAVQTAGEWKMVHLYIAPLSKALFTHSHIHTPMEEQNCKCKAPTCSSRAIKITAQGSNDGFKLYQP